MVKVKVGWASLDEKEVVCFNHPMVKVKVRAFSMIYARKIGFNHPMVKVKGVNIIFKDTKDTSFQPPYGES